jgi:hypothetical protein
MATTRPGRTLGLLLSLVLAALAVGVSAGTAQAADGYRYWNYYHLKDGAWGFSDKGAAQYVPKDGSVEGYRYGTSTVQQGLKPRADLDTVSFAWACGETEAVQGKKRVAVLIDYGTKADADGAEVPAPRADCAVVDQDATGQQVLGSVADVRTGQGMICGIDGYPPSGCGVQVKDPHVATGESPVRFRLAGQSSAEGGNELTWPLAGAGAAVVVIGGAALALNRRRNA